jgi:curli biogenesis system outer membrane secretion channel CsgG
MRHATVFYLALAACLVPAAAGAKQRPAAAGGSLDEGRLEVSYFAAEAEFHETDEIDYLWVSPGFSVEGKTLSFAPWPEPEFRGEKASERDTKDTRLARMMTSDMHEVFADAFSAAFKNRLTVADKGGNLRVEGRIVDCSTGSNAAKFIVGFGAGAGSTTIDLRFVDTASGKVVAGVHHRVVSGTSWSTTDSKFVNWVDEFAEEGAKKGFEKIYQKGGRVRR